MGDSWIVSNLNAALTTWNDKLGEIWQLLTQSPQTFKDGQVWAVMVGIHGALQAIGYGLLVLFFAAGVVKTCGTFVEAKRPEQALKLFIRFALAKAAVTYGLDLMLAIFQIVQGMVSTVINQSGVSGMSAVTLPQELIDAINEVGFWDSIPLWAVTLIGGLLITVLSFVMILTVYQGSVLPAFATGVLAAKFEKFLRKHVPDAIDLIVTPFLTLLVGILLAMFALGPILHTVENGVLFVVEGLLTLPMGIGGLIYGSFGQLLGIFGIHHILNFLEISMLAQDGWNYLNPIGTCGNVAQAGAVLAVAIKATSAKTKQIAYPSCLSALLGITEPAVFGVNLRFVKPFVMSMIGGGVGGFLASFFGLRATGMSITGIPGTLLYLNEQLPLYILVNVVAFAVAFVLTWLFGFNHKMEQA